VAYDELGIKTSWEAIERRAAEECGKMEEVLREIAVIDEPNPAKINWNC
jgi:actin-like ATPase involved in cell morphogenesis